MATVGWSQERTDEVLVPVIRDMNQKQVEGTQSNITHFFDGGIGAGAFAPRKKIEAKSKRMENAMLNLHEQALRRRRGEGVQEDGGVEEEVEPAPKRVKKTKPRAKRKARVSPTNDGDYDDADEEEEDAPPATAKRRKTSGRKSARKG